jgi:phospholipid/cholesterol/gamma-HCH transport system ATP-binding protein
VRIEIKNLHKSFGSNDVLRGIDLTLEPGGISIILGGSGTGKSVLIKHIVGLLRPDRGEVRVDGRDVTRLSEREWYPIRRRMGYIFQAGGLIHSLTVGDNVGLALSENRVSSPREIRRVVAEKLEWVGLAGKEQEMPANLSGGMIKRVAIARALASDPELLLYDEPTAGLDPPTAGSVDAVIERVGKELGVTTVVVTHDMLTVFDIADHVHFLSQGKVIVSGPPREFVSSGDERVRAFLKRDMRGRSAFGGSGEYPSAWAEPAAPDASAAAAAADPQGTAPLIDNTRFRTPQA